jgi:putative OPT family oligopeptide transporter
MAMGRVTSPDDRVAILAVGAVVCIAAAIAGDTSQDLKTGFLVGATPYRQQIGEMIGVLASALTMGLVLMVLHQGIGIGSQDLSAPQATLMSMVIDGVTQENLPWDLLFIGAAIALIVELIGLPSLALAVGLYLPVSLSSPILIGGAIRLWVEKKYRDDVRFHKREKGILFSSGLIAGAALIGVLISGFVYMGDKWSKFDAWLQKVIDLTDGLGALPSFLIFLFLCAMLLLVILSTSRRNGDDHGISSR